MTERIETISVPVPRQAGANPLSLLPDPFTLQNYEELTRPPANVPLWTFNSVIFAGAVTLGRVFLCSLAGYARARLNFPGRNFIFLAVLATMMIPGVACSSRALSS